MLALFYLLLWIILMGTAIFATQNITLLQVKFLTLTSIDIPLGLLLVSSAGLGAIALSLWQNWQIAPPTKRPPTTETYTKYAEYEETDDYDDFDDEPLDDWV